MDDIKTQWLRKTHNEFSTRARLHSETAARYKLHGNYAKHNEYITAATAWTSAADMLQYLINGDYDCLKEFLYNKSDDE